MRTQFQLTLKPPTSSLSPTLLHLRFQTGLGPFQRPIQGLVLPPRQLPALSFNHPLNLLPNQPPALPPGHLPPPPPQPPAGPRGSRQPPVPPRPPPARQATPPHHTIHMLWFLQTITRMVSHQTLMHSRNPPHFRLFISLRLSTRQTPSPINSQNQPRTILSKPPVHTMVYQRMRWP